MRARITKRLVDSIAATETEQVVTDTELRGFCLRVLPSGVKRYDVRYLLDGRRRRYKIAEHGVLTADQAREEARRVLGLVALGQDPAEDREATRHSGAVADLVERFLAARAPELKASTLDCYRRVLAGYVVPALGAYRVAAVTRADVQALHSRASVGHAYQGNRVLAVVKLLFAWAEQVGERRPGTNPGRGIRANRERPRHRLLTAAEIGRLGAALRLAEPTGIPDDRQRPRPEDPYAVLALRLLLLTGCREGEILHLRWEHVDLERRWLTLPDSKTGPKVEPLGAPAVALLAGVERLSPWVVPGWPLMRHRTSLDHTWHRVRRHAGLADVRIHDLRHAFASIAAAGGQGLPIIGAILGHAKAQTTQRYAHLAISPLLAAADLVSAEIAAALEGKSGEVVKIGR